MMQLINKILGYRHDWICPYCGNTKKTRKDNAPRCKGSSRPQDWDFHLYLYPMQRVVEL